MRTFHIDGKTIDFYAIGDDIYGVDYWLTRPPQERLAECERLRQEYYGYDPATAKIEKVVQLIDTTVYWGRKQVEETAQVSATKPSPAATTSS